MLWIHNEGCRHIFLRSKKKSVPWDGGSKSSGKFKLVGKKCLRESKLFLQFIFYGTLVLHFFINAITFFTRVVITQQSKLYFIFSEMSRTLHFFDSMICQFILFWFAKNKIYSNFYSLLLFTIFSDPRLVIMTVYVGTIVKTKLNVLYFITHFRQRKNLSFLFPSMHAMPIQNTKQERMSNTENFSQILLVGYITPT